MRFLKSAMTALALLVMPSLALAQSDSGRITGSVRDSSSAVIAGASVTVKNERTGETRTVTSDTQGRFVAAPLRPSTYTLRADAQGFAPIEYTALPVAVGQELALDLEADGLAAAAVAQLVFDRLEEVGGFLLVDIELAVSGDADDPAALDLCAGEKCGQVFGDDLAEEQVAAGVVLAGQFDETREDPRDLDEGDARADEPHQPVVVEAGLRALEDQHPAGGGADEREQADVASGIRRLRAHLSQPGGPCLHGHLGRAQVALRGLGGRRRLACLEPGR